MPWHRILQVQMQSLSPITDREITNIAGVLGMTLRGRGFTFLKVDNTTDRQSVELVKQPGADNPLETLAPLNRRCYLFPPSFGRRGRTATSVSSQESIPLGRSSEGGNYFTANRRLVNHGTFTKTFHHAIDWKSQA